MNFPPAEDTFPRMGTLYYYFSAAHDIVIVKEWESSQEDFNRHYYEMVYLTEAEALKRRVWERTQRCNRNSQSAPLGSAVESPASSGFFEGRVPNPSPKMSPSENLHEQIRILEERVNVYQRRHLDFKLKICNAAGFKKSLFTADEVVKAVTKLKADAEVISDVRQAWDRVKSLLEKGS